MRFVKYEAGDTLKGIGLLREKSAGQIKLFSGDHGRTLIEELRAGSSGTMPAASFADLYVATWDLWHAGRYEEAAAMQRRTVRAVAVVTRYGFEGLKYFLQLHGVFGNYAVRKPRNQGFSSAAKIAAGGSKTKPTPLDAAGKKEIHDLLDTLKPWLKA